MAVEVGAKDLAAEFGRLRSQARVLFEALQSLPIHGRDVWKPLYAHVFRAFDGLWRFQQTHRAALLAQGLERWEIGDVAAKIGQLYFFAYLRGHSSDALTKASSFYQAVVERAYFGDPGSLEITVRLKLADKNVRFLLRYAMVVLLQNQSPTAVQQLQLRVNAAVATWRQQQPPEAPDHELAAIPPRLTHFCDALAALSLDVLDNPAPRLLPDESLAREVWHVHRAHCRSLAAPYRNVGAILLANGDSQQPMFNTLALDTFRMLHALQRPFDNPARVETVPAAALSTSEPHLTMLQLPNSLTQALALLTAASELPPNDVLVVYASNAISDTPCVNASDLRPVRSRVPLVLLLSNVTASSNLELIHECTSDPAQPPCWLMQFEPDTSSAKAQFVSFVHAPMTAFALLLGVPRLRAAVKNQLEDSGRLLMERILHRVTTAAFGSFHWLLGNSVTTSLLLHVIFYLGVLRWRQGPAALEFLSQCSPALSADEVAGLVPFADLRHVADIIGAAAQLVG